MNQINWKIHVTPTLVLKWTGVIFVVVLEILILISIILAMFGVF